MKPYTPLFKKRFELMREYAEKYGCEYDGKYIISFWELAFNLNNCWHACDFISSKKKAYYQDKGLITHGKKWSLPDYALGAFRRPIKHVVNKHSSTTVEYKVCANYADYLIFPKRSKDA